MPKKQRSPAQTVCEWFVMCTNEATTTQSHPVLGDVPICDRCLQKYKRMSGEK